MGLPTHSLLHFHVFSADLLATAFGEMGAEESKICPVQLQQLSDLFCTSSSLFSSWVVQGVVVGGDAVCASRTLWTLIFPTSVIKVSVCMVRLIMNTGWNMMKCKRIPT